MDWKLVQKQAEALLEGERELIPNLANLSALLKESMEELNWVGCYLEKRGELLLGPFQGKPACIHIPWGKGVCGTAAEQDSVLLVPNVHAFPGHIACDGASRSELVLPIHSPSGRVCGVLDLDSPLENRFTEEDAAGLGEIVRLLEKGCDWED